MKHVLFIIIALSLVAFPNIILAEPEGRQCIPEPTDDFIDYGDLITCSISPVGDSDLIRFIGESGEKVIIQATDTSGGSQYPTICMELFNPDGTPVDSKICNAVAARKDVIIDQSGEYLIRISEAGNDHVMNYVLVLDRVFPAPPTAKTINPGPPLLNEQINPVGDLDFFTFESAAGDNISLKRPDGTLVSGDCDAVSAIIELPTDMSGEYSILVYEAGNDHVMTFNLEYQCLFGDCPAFARPICDIEMNQTNFVDGDTVIAEDFLIANPGPDPVRVEWKVWLSGPNFPPVPVINAGSDCSLVLPGEFDFDFGPIPFFSVTPAFARGEYELSCRLLDCATGRTQNLDINEFNIDLRLEISVDPINIKFGQIYGYGRIV
jgi:hypothetical protein